MFKRRVAELIGMAMPELKDIQIEDLLEIPPRPEMGDFALPCFTLARVLRKAPHLIAQEIAGRIEKADWLNEVKTEGGYLNFTIQPTTYVSEVVDGIVRGGFGGGTQSGVVVIDFSSPNIAKAFSIGHIRSTVIGNSLARIYKYLGYDVERVNHLGDWGTQFGKLIVAYHLWGDDVAIRKNPIQELVKIYVRYHEEVEHNPGLDDEARQWFKRLEDGDEEARRLWVWFREESLNEFERVYERMNIEFDSYLGESFYNDKIEPTLQQIVDKGLVSESEGALVVDVGEDMPPCLLRKRDGATLYATRDLAAAMYRWETYRFQKLLYVVGITQSLHFRQVFRVLDKMGFEWVDRLEHVAFGTILFGAQAMGTRRGNVIYLEDILDEAVRRAAQIIDDRNPDLPNREAVAEDVGVGAVLFNELAQNRIKDVEFDWDKVVSFDGDTGPYVQYAYARAKSVLRRAEVASLDNYDPAQLTDERSLALVRLLARFPEVVRTAAETNEPSTVARYALDLAAGFNSFYHANRILGVEPSLQVARTILTKATSEILATSMDLLGLKAPEEM